MFWRNSQFYEKHKWLCFICFFIASLLLGSFSSKLLDRFSGTFSQRGNLARSNEMYSVKGVDDNFVLINPLLSCGDIDSISNGIIDIIKRNVSTYISSAKKVDNNAETIAVYFRDLNNGPWFGIDEKTEFIPGSLLKVPFAIAMYKLADEDKNILASKKFYDRERSDYEEYFLNGKQIKIGETYTNEELIQAMIERSDNNAALLLTEGLNKKDFEAIYRDLGILEPKDGNYSMSVRTYASFFRILYNATYLSKDLSERLLSFLSQTTFEKGLREGVPSNVLVAHKFGERAYSDSNIKQLHDCGIVYFPKRPYLLCIMTRGYDFDKLINVIKNISAIVYGDMHKEALK